MKGHKAEYVELPEDQLARVARELGDTQARVQLLAWQLKHLARVRLSDFAYRMGVALTLGETYTGEPCYKTMDTLGKELYKSASAVRRARRELVERGLTMERPHDIDPPPSGVDPRYTPVTIYVIWHNQYGAPFSDNDVEKLLGGAPAGFRGVKNDTPTSGFRGVKNARAVKNDSKAVNTILVSNTNVLLTNAGEEPPPAVGDGKSLEHQLALELVGMATPAQPAPTELDATRPSEVLLFQMINANRVAQGKRKQRARFATLEQRKEYEALAQPYGSLEALKPALERAFARGVYTVRDLLPVLRSQAKRANGNGHTPQRPATPPRKIASEEESRAYIAKMKAELAAERAGA